MSIAKNEEDFIPPRLLRVDLLIELTTNRAFGD
jgi:hypothetical protein